MLEVNEPDRRAREATLNSLLEEFDIARVARRRRFRCPAANGGGARSPARSPASLLSCCSTSPSRASIRSRLATFRISCVISKGAASACLITDHNVRETLGLIDRAYIIHSGHVLTEGPPDEIIAHPDVRRFYLGEDFRM